MPEIQNQEKGKYFRKLAQERHFSRLFAPKRYQGVRSNDGLSFLSVSLTNLVLTVHMSSETTFLIKNINVY